MIMRLRGQKYLSVLQLTAVLLLSCSLTPSTSSARLLQQNQTEPPVLKEGIIETLKSGHGKITVAGLVQRIRKRGVAFQLTPAEDKEIRAAGDYLGQKGLDELIEAVRASFRPPRNSPFRITYILLEGNSIDLFLQGQISRRWNTTVSGNSFIVKNDTFNKLSYLVNTFSEEVSFPNAYDVQKGNRIYTYPVKAPLDETSRRKFFVGVITDMEETLGLPVEELPSLINSLNDPKQSWRVLWTGERRRRKPLSYDVDNFLFRKFNVNRSELELLEPTTLLDFYLYITREGVPPDFGYFDLQLTKGVDGCEAHAGGPLPDYYPAAVFYGPTLAVRIAIIENVSKEPVDLSNFIVKENNSERLRVRDDDQALLATQTNKRQDLFPPKTLQPSEKIAVPMELIVSYSEDEGIPLRVPDEAINRLKQSGGIKFSPVTGAPINIKSEVIEHIINRPPLSLPATQYVYGPSVNLQAIEINSRDYIVRNFDPKSLLINAFGEEGGSCPYIYTYLSDRGIWLNEGVILAGINEKYKESADEKLLRRFDGRILIRERDPENSFVDSMFIKAIAPDGREAILYPQNEKLRFSDGEYLKLKQGEQLIVNFAFPKNFIAQKYVLVTRGYYVPYKTTPARPDMPPGNKLK